MLIRKGKRMLRSIVMNELNFQGRDAARIPIISAQTNKSVKDSWN